MRVHRASVMKATIALVLIGFGLGGCKNVSKEQYDLAVQEANQLRQDKAACDESNRLKDAQLVSLQSQLDSARSQPISAPQFDPRPVSSPSGDSMSGGDVTFTLAGAVAFTSGSEKLTTAAKRELDSISRQIRSQYAGRDIRVEGHTDATPIRKSKWASNEALSQARADSVREYLISKGLSGGRIQAIGYGSARPKATAQASRRVEIVVLGN